MMTDYVAVAQKMFPQEMDDSGYPLYLWLSDYTPIINYLGTVAIRVDDHDYQGDTRVLFADTGKGYGYLNFGWGSCSGCDALQACNSHTDVAELIQRLDLSIKWLPRDEMLKFFQEHDWEGDYSWSSEEQKKFVDMVISYLQAAQK